jgi:hypothetical protein
MGLGKRFEFRRSHYGHSSTILRLVWFGFATKYNKPRRDSYSGFGIVV